MPYWISARTRCYRPHDHRWPLVSLCLKGVLRETGRRPDGGIVRAEFGPGSEV